jgi:hypothetical protein
MPAGLLTPTSELPRIAPRMNPQIVRTILNNLYPAKQVRVPTSTRRTAAGSS